MVEIQVGPEMALPRRGESLEGSDSDKVLEAIHTEELGRQRVHKVGNQLSNRRQRLHLMFKNLEFLQGILLILRVCKTHIGAFGPQNIENFEQRGYERRRSWVGRGHLTDSYLKRLNDCMLRERSKTLRPVGKIHVAPFVIDQMGDELRAGVRRSARSIQNALSSVIQSLKIRIKRHSLQRRQIAFECKNVRRLH